MFSKKHNDVIVPKYVVQMYSHGGAYDEMRVTSRESALFIVKAAVAKRLKKIVLIKGKQRATYSEHNGYQPIIAPHS